MAVRQIRRRSIEDDALPARAVAPPAVHAPGIIEVGGLDGANGFTLTGIDAGDLAGLDVASAGDVNGDGIGDFIIGAFGGDPGGDEAAGECYVVFGTDTGFPATLSLGALDGANGFRISGIDIQDRAGTAVAAGDVNGDGFADLIAGASGDDPGSVAEAGSTYVVFGKASFGATVNLANLNGANGFRFDGIGTSDQSGREAGSGDVNGDGFADLIVGAPYADPGGQNSAGEVYVLFGAASGIGTSIDAGALTGANGFRIQGIDAFDKLGSAVAAGDVNGDGHADLILGAPDADADGDINAGEVYVVFGKPSGFAADVDLATLDGTNGFRIDGDAAGDLAGIAVASAGDVNGDGFEDVVIGASYADPDGDASAGASYIVFGKAGGWGASLDLASLDGSNGFRIDGADPGDRSGRSVAIIGDWNGDGFDDVAIGARYDNVAGTRSGAVYIVFGKAKGWGAAFDLSLIVDSNAEIQVHGDYDEYDGVFVYGDYSYEELYSVAGGGDINGDGLIDLIAGAWRADVGGEAVVGKTYTIFGRTPDASVHRAGSAIGQTIWGGTGRDTLDGKAGADTLMGQQGKDLLIGGGGADALDGGGGIDIASYVKSAFGIDIDLIAGTGEGGDAEGDTLINVENVDGSKQDDTIQGSVIGNHLSGGKGDDSLKGKGGADTLEGGAGADTLDGGEGVDTASYANAPGRGLANLDGVRASLMDPLDNSGEARGDSYVSIENLIGSDYRDTLEGDAGGNRLDGGAGGDLLKGRQGNDTLNGGPGFDTLVGGPGADTFEFGSPYDRSIDTIETFSKTSVDQIALGAGFGLPSGALAASAFRKGTAAADADDRIIYDQTTGKLYFDPDGNGALDKIQFATLADTPNLAASDFIVN